MSSTILVTEGTSVPWSTSVQLNVLKMPGSLIHAISICLLICKAGTVSGQAACPGVERFW